VVGIPLTGAEHPARHSGQHPVDAGVVFTAAHGEILRRSNFIRRHFHPAVEAAKVPAAMRFHDLRHTSAAILISRGWSLEQLKPHLGPSSIRVTSDRYAHLYEGHDDDLVDALDRDLRARPQRPRPTPPTISTVSALRSEAG
jgi:integrase